MAVILINAISMRYRLPDAREVSKNLPIPTLTDVAAVPEMPDDENCSAIMLAFHSAAMAY